MNAILRSIPGLALLLLLTPCLAQAFCFEEAGSAFNLSPRLLENIARLESGMNPSATHRNPDGSVDIGLMQINSYWINAARLDRERLVSDACYNTRTGARILRDCIDRLGYTWEAVGCYNATSSDKRRNYAWKVYRRLVAEGKNRYAKPAAPPSTSAAEAAHEGRDNVSLTFSIEEQDGMIRHLP